MDICILFPESAVNVYVLVLSAIDVIREKSVGGLISGELNGSKRLLQ